MGLRLPLVALSEQHGVESGGAASICAIAPDSVGLVQLRARGRAEALHVVVPQPVGGGLDHLAGVGDLAGHLGALDDVDRDETLRGVLNLEVAGAV